MVYVQRQARPTREQRDQDHEISAAVTAGHKIAVARRDVGRAIAASFLGVAPFVAELFAAMGLADEDFDAGLFGAGFFGAGFARAEDAVVTFIGAMFFVAADFCLAVVVAGPFLAVDRAEVILGEVIV